MRLTEKEIRNIIQQELQNLNLNERRSSTHMSSILFGLQNAKRQLDNAIGSEIRGDKIQKAQRIRDELERLSGEISDLA